MKGINTKIQIAHGNGSEEDFIEKVEYEKNHQDEVGSLSSPDKIHDSDEDNLRKKTVFSSMLDPEAVLAEKEKKRTDKKKLIEAMNIR